ncbi:MAG TPA: SDR family oxidoreductase [Nitrososphaeraceae archaeon]|nr:SDR family oxidoreductase [Nitrososphaeraceae archaeon]
MKQESKKTAIITGSDRGIGKETAIILAKKSVNVVICSRTQSEINSAVEEINKLTGNSSALGIRSDVSISSQVKYVVKSTIEKFGSSTIDILVNNAGVAFNRKLIDMPEEEWDQTINSNLKGAFLFTKAVLPYMISNRSGVILNVNSGAGKTGFSNLSAYCASKFGLVGLAESLALEVSEYENIRVLTIFLGEVATKMWQEYDFKYYQKNKSKMLQPKDVAVKIAQMIFDSKTYKNGDLVEMYSSNM